MLIATGCADRRTVFQELSHNFPIKLQPDHRAELFLEWVEEHPAEVGQWKVERGESRDQDYAAAYAAHHAEKQDAEFERRAALAKAKVRDLHQADIQDAHAKARKLQLASEKAWDRYYDHTWPRGKTKAWAHERAVSADQKAREAWRKVEELEAGEPPYEEAVPF